MHSTQIGLLAAPCCGTALQPIAWKSSCRPSTQLSLRIPLPDRPATTLSSTQFAHQTHPPSDFTVLPPVQPVHAPQPSRLLAIYRLQRQPPAFEYFPAAPRRPSLAQQRRPATQPSLLTPATLTTRTAGSNSSCCCRSWLCNPSLHGRHAADRVLQSFASCCHVPTRHV